MDRASLFEWPNRIALGAFIFVFAKGIFEGNSFGGFVLGLGSGAVWWAVVLALVGMLRFSKRADARRPNSGSVASSGSAELPSPYLLALRELEQERPDEATLAEAYAVSDGDPDRTRAAYLRLRAQQLAKS